MVYSTGIDMVDVDRVRQGYRRFGDRYIKKMFSEPEAGLLGTGNGEIVSAMAGKLAAKEAVIKCLGVFFNHGVAFHDIEILERLSASPYVSLSPRLKHVLNGKSVMLSIAHERRYATAVAIITDEV